MSGENAVISVGQFFSALLTLRDSPGIPGKWQVYELGTKKGQTTVGQLLMEPMGPVCVCVHVRMLCACTHTTV